MRRKEVPQLRVRAQVMQGCVEECGERRHLVRQKVEFQAEGGCDDEVAPELAGGFGGEEECVEDQDPEEREDVRGQFLAQSECD